MLADRPRELRTIPPKCNHQWLVKRIKDAKLIKELCEANKILYAGHKWIDIRRCAKCKKYKQAGDS